MQIEAWKVVLFMIELSIYVGLVVEDGNHDEWTNPD